MGSRLAKSTIFRGVPILELNHIFTKVSEYDTPYSETFLNKNIGCDLKTNSEAYLKWAQHYFGAYYDCGKEDSRADIRYTVSAIIDETWYGLILDKVHKLPSVEIDYHHRRKAQKAELENGIQIIVYEMYHTITVVDLNRRMFCLITDGKHPEARFEPTRAIREIFTRELEKQGFFLMHAAVVEREGGAYLFFGRQGAGKTTTILSLLEKGCNLIANDKAYIGIQNNRISVIGWPGAVSITLQTMVSFSNLRTILPEMRNRRYPQNQLKAETDLCNFEAIKNNRKEKVDLTTSEAASLFQVKVVKESFLNKMIRIERSEDLSGIEPLNKEVSCSVLKDSFFYPDHAIYPDWFNMRNHGQASSDFSKLLEKITDVLPILRLNRAEGLPIEEGLKVVNDCMMAENFSGAR